ncbi:sensor histidine kinase [Clostridiaceae bacterium NSJ-31]|uniref:Sensor histidine kinase n=1 Tax=Ligaoa zhengdingensis TaxID=2763658 RepID=A0A926DYQ6_9FIRM|nr:GHKL domain-containing protein [Ligaoa zhengdingensis]MBC8546551.1 sensor histidine kinase [Ligaoa zhengdingensis]
MDKSKLRPLLVPLLMVLAALALFPLFYRCDNKYTRPGRQPIGGVLTLSEAELRENPLHYLIYEWEVYPGVLLTPDDFDGGAPDLYRRYVPVGRFGGLDLGQPGRARHGSATYRLTLDLPESAGEYALELPEIFSAYRLYIGGDLVLEMGDPDPAGYREEIQTRIVTLSAAGRVQLLLAVSDHSGLYGGLTHPPAFGSLDAVLYTRNIQYLLHLAGVLLAFLGSALALCFGLRGRLKRGILSALCCLCYAGTTCYPLLHTLTPTTYQPWYPLEITSFYALLLFAVMLQNELCEVGGRAQWLTPLPCLFGLIAAAVCSAGAAVWGAGAVRAFSVLSTCLKWYAALHLIAVSGWALWRGTRHSPILLGASLFLSLSLLFDRLLPLYEPVCGGWFYEIGGSVLAASLAGALWFDLADAYRFRLSYAIELEQMEHQLLMQRDHYRQLSSQVDAARAASHDLRHHMRALSAFAEQGDLAKIRAYLQSYEPRLTAQEIETFSNHPLADALLRYFAPAARRAGATFDVLLALPPDLSFPDDELCILLGNLLENAVEACERQQTGRRFIYLRGDTAGGRFRLVLDNSFDGAVVEKRGRYCSSKRRGFGFGVRSVQAIVEQHGGLCLFEPDGEVFRVSLMIPLPAAAPDGAPAADERPMNQNRR